MPKTHTYVSHTYIQMYPSVCLYVCMYIWGQEEDMSGRAY